VKGEVITDFLKDCSIEDDSNGGSAVVAGISALN